MSESSTTTQHAPNCPRLGWHVTPSSGVRGVRIARCHNCGAVELRTIEVKK